MILALVAAMGLSLSSCNDAAIASTLEGTWEGYTSMASNYSGRTYTSSYSYVDFQTDPFSFTSGTGYWVDYYSDAPWDYIANHIDWTVKDHIITVYFREDNLYMYFSQYSLSDKHFRGVIYDDPSGTHYSFDLTHISSPNWNDYSWGWHWNYAPSVNGKAPAQSDEKPQRILLGK